MKDYISNWSEKVFEIQNVKNTVSRTYIKEDLHEENFGAFYEKELQKKNDTESTIENVIKRKGEKIHVKWKANSFNSLIDIKDIVI